MQSIWHHLSLCGPIFCMRNFSFVTRYLAVDSVNHDLLLNKLVQLSIDSTWFASYLHDRTHSVKIDKIMSEAKSNLYSLLQ